jgi:hypothetical protein
MQPAAHAGFDNIQFVCAKVHEFPFDKESFDLEAHDSF